MRERAGAPIVGKSGSIAPGRSRLGCGSTEPI